MEARPGRARGKPRVLISICSSWKERDQVRISTMSALGHMLCQVNKFKPGPVLRREIYSFLVPLLLNFQDNNPEVVKVLVTSVLPASAWLYPCLLEHSLFPSAFFPESSRGCAFNFQLFSNIFQAPSLGCHQSYPDMVLFLEAIYVPCHDFSYKPPTRPLGG